MALGAANGDSTWDGAKSADPNSIRGLEHRTIDAKNFRVGIVAARWNAKVVDTLVDGAKSALLAAGVADHNIVIERVAGTFFHSINYIFTSMFVQIFSFWQVHCSNFKLKNVLSLFQTATSSFKIWKLKLHGCLCLSGVIRRSCRLWKKHLSSCLLDSNCVSEKCLLVRDVLPTYLIHCFKPFKLNKI